MQKNIYLARQENSSLCKIGITKHDPKQRILQLQTGNAAPLILIETFVTNHDFLMEASIHAHFKLKRKEGEWFDLTNEEIEEFRTICEKKEALMDFLKENNHFWQYLLFQIILY